MPTCVFDCGGVRGGPYTFSIPRPYRMHTFHTLPSPVSGASGVSGVGQGSGARAEGHGGAAKVDPIINGHFRLSCPNFGARLIDSKGLTAREDTPGGYQNLFL